MFSYVSFQIISWSQQHDKNENNNTLNVLNLCHIYENNWFHVQHKIKLFCSPVVTKYLLMLCYI